MFPDSSCETGCAVELYFDPALEAEIRARWALLDAAGWVSPAAAGFRPHVSLAIFEDVDDVGCRPVIEAFAGQVAPIDIRLDALGVFGQTVLFLTPVPTRSLLDLHDRFHRLAMPGMRTLRPYYAPGRWTPHCTLLNGEPPTVARALPLLLAAAGPVTGRIEQIGLCRFLPAVVPFSIPLSG